MRRTPVKSSNISEIGYDESVRVMEILFTSGDVYQYAFVSPETYQRLLAAESVGKHLHAVIKPAHSFRKVERAPDRQEKPLPGLDNTILRRCSLQRMTPAELAIRAAVLVVEEAGAHPLLTDAVVLLGQAQNKVADFVDGPGSA